MTMHTLPMSSPTAFARFAGRAKAVALRAVAFVRAFKNRRDMELLAGLDDRMLRDIGLTRGDLRDAAAEPLWRDPTNILAVRANERRRAARGYRGAVYEVIERPQLTLVAVAPPLAPANDDWSSRQFPARSRYY